MSLRVTEVPARDGRAFERLPRAVRDGGSAAWTPPLPGEERQQFDARRNPSLEGIAFARWVAWRDGRAVGRVAAFAPAAPAGEGWFGFFEAVDDVEVGRALLDAAEGWLRARGRTTVHGPIAIHPRDRIGLLTEGFERPATLMLPWNPPYHARLLEAAGYAPAVGLRSYGWTPDQVDHRGVRALAERLADRSAVRIRPLDPRALERETQLVATLLNRALATTWGWVPVTPAEAEEMARQLRPIVDPSLVLFAEDERGPCGVALSVPDANWLVRRIGGRLLPFGWIGALRHRRRIPWARLMALAVLPGRRATGTVARLMYDVHDAWCRRGLAYAELGQVFDDNAAMRRVLDRMRLPVVHRYAVFSRHLDGGPR